MKFLRESGAIAAKDLRVEFRGRHAVGVVLPFAVTLLVAFGLSFGPGRSLLEAIAPGLLWLAVLFAAVLSFRGGYEAEVDDAALEELLLAPVDKAAVFLGKAAAVTVQLWILEAAVVLLAAALFGVSLGEDLLALVATFGLGTIGLAAIGNLFGALAATARAREAVFPLLVMPIAIPVLVAGVKATTLAEAGRTAMALPWLGLLFVFALLFLSAGSLLYGQLLED